MRDYVNAQKGEYVTAIRNLSVQLLSCPGEKIFCYLRKGFKSVEVLAFNIEDKKSSDF